MSGADRVFVVPWNDDPARSLAAARALYPRHAVVMVEKRKLRESPFREQIRILRRLRGKAVVFCFRSLTDLSAPLLLRWIGLLHRCPVTVWLDDAGNKRVYRHWGWFYLAPLTAFAIASDACVLLVSLVRLKIGLRGPFGSAGSGVARADGALAYLFPHPMLRSSVGGAMSHVRGFLSGASQCGFQCRVFTARDLPQDYFDEQFIPLSRRPSLFLEAMALGYNWRFARAVRRSLAREWTIAVYQRHSRFSVAGALLSRKLGVPLVVEYNGSEEWVADNWDPARFRQWLRLCEAFALRVAALIVVVSEPLRKELIQRGITETKILVNPNAVDPDAFQPQIGGAEVRAKLGIQKDDLVVCFVGTFSYWHGISVLQEAARRLLEMGSGQELPQRLRFLLIGDGPLRSEVADYLQSWAATGDVVFTGVVPHHAVPRYLDAADIFVSPHTPMEKGEAFFGSPTKIFEYMAMGKAIIASRLGQMEEVLTHGDTGWLVNPGDVEDLVAAIIYLARNAKIRASLGDRAREKACVSHTWKHNAEAVWHALLGGGADGRNAAESASSSECIGGMKSAQIGVSDNRQ
jgi:glycosyltransferase involved in cell wall biosynthesis